MAHHATHNPAQTCQTHVAQCRGQHLSDWLDMLKGLNWQVNLHQSNFTNSSCQALAMMQVVVPVHSRRSYLNARWFGKGSPNCQVLAPVFRRSAAARI